MTAVEVEVQKETAVPTPCNITKPSCDNVVASCKRDEAGDMSSQVSGSAEVPIITVIGEQGNEPTEKPPSAWNRFKKRLKKRSEKHENTLMKRSSSMKTYSFKKVCNLLLNHFAEVNSIKFNLSTPMHVAAGNGFLDIAKLLIFHGADVNRKDIEQMTPIHKAALYNKVDLIQLLMKHGGDINAKDKKNMQPLHHACWKGQSDAVQFLIDNGAMIADADTSLKTPLHWTVQFGHYETLIILLKHGGVNILDATDKNDQTALHYAAYFGNVSVLKTLLEAGAKPETKDQEERTPLHIAAQYDNVSCVEALIQVSNHETNDDDVDGRTPLMLASLYGHYQLVQVLLSLGAEVQKRDDEHCTSLMLAATHGHTLVIRCLLDNQANVNDVDKNKNTALHYACAGGHVDTVQLLLDKRADVTLKNTHNQAPVDLAIDNLRSDVGVTMLKHRSWRDTMGVRDQNGATVMDKLIAKLPDAAMVVLDHCVERTSRDDDDPTLTMVFDYQYIDPGPDDPACDKKKYFALNTMVTYENDRLLSHPLCQNILSQKWVRFGRRTFYWNLIVYILYLLFLNLYVMSVDHAINPEYKLDKKNFCPIMKWNNSWPPAKQNYTLLNGEPDSDQLRSTIGTKAFVYGLMSQILVVIIMLKEIFKIYSQRLRYFFNLFNWIAWILLASTFAFTYPGNRIPCLLQWRAGWIATFFAWINFIMYLRRIDFVGIYVIMFVTVLLSLMKAILLFFFFSWAFASAFYIIMSGDKENKIYDDGDDDEDDSITHFQPIHMGVLNVFVMSLGEVQPMGTYLTLSPDEFSTDVLLLMSMFLFLMPIVLMNLLIGIAVGDIEKIQHNAYLKRIALQVDILYQLENNMPKFLQRKAYIRRATVKPNEMKTALLDKIWRYLFGSTRDVQFIQADQKDKTHHMLDRLGEQVNMQQQKLKGMTALLQQQTMLLQQIGHKLNITDTEFHSQDPMGLDSNPFPDQSSLFEHNSMYDNVSLGKFQQRGRYKSVRVTGMDRPSSVII